MAFFVCRNQASSSLNSAFIILVILLYLPVTPVYIVTEHCDVKTTSYMVTSSTTAGVKDGKVI